MLSQYFKCSLYNRAGNIAQRFFFMPITLLWHTTREKKWFYSNLDSLRPVIAPHTQKCRVLLVVCNTHCVSILFLFLQNTRFNGKRYVLFHRIFLFFVLCKSKSQWNFTKIPRLILDTIRLWLGMIHLWVWISNLLSLKVSNRGVVNPMAHSKTICVWFTIFCCITETPLGWWAGALLFIFLLSFSSSKLNNNNSGTIAKKRTVFAVCARLRVRIRIKCLGTHKSFVLFSQGRNHSE